MPPYHLRNYSLIGGGYNMGQQPAENPSAPASGQKNTGSIQVSVATNAISETGVICIKI